MNNAFQALLNKGIFEGQHVGASVGATPVAATASLAATRDVNGGRVTKLDAAAGLTVTLPAATGSGDTYGFFVGTTVTSNSIVIQVANATDTMSGRAYVISDNSAAVLGYNTTSTSDTITFNGTTTGGIAGDYVFLEDVGVGKFHVLVMSTATGTEATPFSAAVS